MIDSLKNWWQAHSVGERWLMALLGMAMALVFLWLGVWRPVNGAIDAGWVRQGVALDHNASVRAKVEALSHLPKQAETRNAMPVDQLVGQTAAEAGFTLDHSSSPGAGRMSVSIASARMNALMAWLNKVEAAGVRVQTISITPGTTDGTVAVQIIFQGSTS